MKLLRAFMLILVVFLMTGCITIRIPRVPDVDVHGRVDDDSAEGRVESSQQPHEGDETQEDH